MIYFLLYITIGSLVGLSLAWHKEFTRTNQIVGAVIWPVVIAIFFHSFLKSFLRNREES